jgi:hypothetical protein
MLLLTIYVAALHHSPTLRLKFIYDGIISHIFLLKIFPICLLHGDSNVNVKTERHKQPFVLAGVFDSVNTTV